ncbi:MAG: hypothetical protein MJY52_00970 [Bacteroidaceae bacterium]|nr:hypothetical protein [Bacteroidaceae bacterium]
MKKYLRPSIDVMVLGPTKMFCGSGESDDDWYEIPVETDNDALGTQSAELNPTGESDLMFK